ncbi:unnamed protein product [Effrenium voratum]|nr:unnamed protein product [Effrenium voratum]
MVMPSLTKEAAPVPDAAKTSKVSAAPPAPVQRRARTPGRLAAAFLPYAASEVSSLQSGWRQDYWKEPSPLFTQGLISQDIRYATECSQCKCVIKEAALPPSGHISAEELHQEHCLRWLDSLIEKEKEGLKWPRYSKSEINERNYPQKVFNQHPWSHKWLPGSHSSPKV